ncbi:MAG: DUF354 domain-containing protein [Terriglobia bacterium]
MVAVATPKPQAAAAPKPQPGRRGPSAQAAQRKRIWIDLDNTPHVPFFAPIIRELERRGCSTILTARMAFQVCELADLFHLNYICVGRHYGKQKLLKACGLGIRTLQLLPFAARERPNLALSHGSRAQVLASSILRIPSVLIFDYEFARAVLAPTWAIAPEVIPESAVAIAPERLLRYPGIKEDVYAPAFTPNPQLLPQLGLNEQDLVATARPPAVEAHYHNPEGEGLFEAAIKFLAGQRETKIILLPRNDRQAAQLRHAWADLFLAGKIMIPKKALDGLNLIWHSDLVISGGGTMNREAAALGVPVYSTFRGKIGAVDRYLAEKGRLVLLEGPEDVHAKVIVRRRSRPAKPTVGRSASLEKIVDHIMHITGAQ